MVLNAPVSTPPTKIPAFSLACAALVLVAFLQILISAMALATRLEQSRQVKVIEKEIFKPVVVRVPGNSPPPGESAPPVVSRPPAAPATLPAPDTSLPSPTPLKVPSVADPRSERLLTEARNARVAGDMGRAIIKLEEALAASPNDASVHYELGLVHEQMGIFDVASTHYEKVFQMGVTGAGSLYPLAAAKLRDGFEQPDAMLGKLSLGRVRIFKDPRNEAGQRVVLTIPVQKAPNETIDVAEIAVSVVFFNRNGKGEIVQLEDQSWVKKQWVSLPFDWTADEETLRMTYSIPPQDSQTEHLFGTRSYYGQVVSLLYKGEVLDVQAWPRDLAARIPRASSQAPGDSSTPEFQDTLPPDSDPDVPLLPPLPEK